MQHSFEVHLLLQWLDQNLLLAEALLFPEVSMVAGRGSQAGAGLRGALRTLLERDPPLALHRRQAPPQLILEVAQIEVAPPARSPVWTSNLPVRYPYVRWEQPGGLHRAYLPALGIEVLARSAQALSEKVPLEIEAALQRTGAAGNLSRLAETQRTAMLQIDRLTVTCAVKDPRQRAKEREEEHQEEGEVLREIAEDLCAAKLEPAYEMDSTVRALAELLAGDVTRSVLLIGPAGCGKTALFQELVRCRHEVGLGHTPFWSTSGARLMSGMSGFGAWQDRCRSLVQESSRTKAVIHLGPLLELLEAGRSEHQGQGLASYLRPHLARGQLAAVAEATQDQLALIRSQDPYLLDAFEPLEIQAPPPEHSLRILNRRGQSYAQARRVRLDEQAVILTEGLHRRFMPYSAPPGRPIAFLEQVLDRAEVESVVDRPEVYEAFSRHTGLPRFMIDEARPLNLEEACRFFEARVVGQPEAVAMVLDVLAVAKANLTRPRRPVASLLFIGPTGVGKTETAKALAEFLFGDPARMTRFDLNQYGDAEAVARLTGAGRGRGEGLLTARVREQPFAVLLFDEFEKAHPQFFDLLLQVLGEARLTDRAGRLADFGNTVVILTSNLGAEEYARGRAGLLSEDPDARAHFEKCVRDFLRPELFNRFDRIVPFAPLDRATVRAVADRELKKVRRLLGLRQRRVDLEVAGEALEHLAVRGFEPRYGARPLKRAIAGELLVPLAEELNTRPLSGAQVRVSLEGDVLTIDALAGTAALAEALPAGLAGRASALRRKADRLKQSPEAMELRNEFFRLERLDQRRRKPAWTSASQEVRLGKLRELALALGRLDGFARRAEEQEEATLLALYGGLPEDGGAVRDLGELEASWPDVLLNVFAQTFEDSRRCLLGVFGDEFSTTVRLGRAYFELARTLGYEAAVCWYVPESKAPLLDASAKPVHMRTRKEQEREKAEAAWRVALAGRSIGRKVIPQDIHPFQEQPAGAFGLALELSGALAAVRFMSEEGLHRVPLGEKSQRVLVLTSHENLLGWIPPAGVERQGSLPERPARRHYDSALRVLRDARLESTYQRDGMDLAAAIDAFLMQRAEKLAE